MELSKLEIQILIDIYESDMSAKESIKPMDYELTEPNPDDRSKEFAFYLAKLKILYLIEYDESRAFICGGWINQKYKNNVIMVWGEHIHITRYGIELVSKLRKRTTEQPDEEGSEEDKLNELFTKNAEDYLKKMTGQN